MTVLLPPIPVFATPRRRPAGPGVLLGGAPRGRPRHAEGPAPRQGQGEHRPDGPSRPPARTGVVALSLLVGGFDHDSDTNPVADDSPTTQKVLLGKLLLLTCHNIYHIPSSGS